jgi:GxxExxY protein
MGLIYGELSEQILKSFYHVYNSLGPGFLEKVYENALCISLRNQGLTVDQQLPITVRFEGAVVGEYFADLCVGACIILEIKAGEAIAPEHEAQLLNYLKATGYQLGIILNFGPTATFARRVFSPKSFRGNPPNP